MHRLRTVRIQNRLWLIPQEVDPPGVVNGVLVDPQTYFFWLINRSPGQPADDWMMVLTNSGLPAGYPPYVVPSDNGYYGLTQQIRTTGEVAGRIFLPTGVPDENGYYSHPISPLKDAPNNPGHLLWEWRSLGGPPYVPVHTDGSGSVPNPGDGLSESEVQAMINASLAPLEARIAHLEDNPLSGIQYGTKIALRSNSGFILGLVSGGPTSENQQAEFIGKTAIHAWESLTIEQGEG